MLAVYVGTMAHELAHHFVAGVECGALGRVTFTRFQEVQECQAVAGNLAGPAVGFVLLIWATLLLLRRDPRPLAVAAIVAAIPLLRIMSVVSGGDDLNWTLRPIYGRDVDNWIIAVVVLITLPPLVLLYRALDHRWRPLVYLGLMTIPLVPAAIFQPLDSRYFFSWADKPAEFTQPTVLGMPVFVLVVHVVMITAFVAWGWHVLQEPATRAQPGTLQQGSTQPGSTQPDGMQPDAEAIPHLDPRPLSGS